MKQDHDKSQEIISLRPQMIRYHKIRITADPGHPRSVEIVEDLLSRTDLARCECNAEEGASTWSMIIPEELLDLALEGTAVTVPVDGELFQTDGGAIYYVMDDEWVQLGGIALETAVCWDSEDFDDFERQVVEHIRSLIQIEMQNLSWPGDKAGDDIFGRIEDKVNDEMDVFTWTEDDIHEAVQEAFKSEIKLTVG